MKALDHVLASKIKELRVGLGLLQAQFAQRLNVSPTQISEWEKGTKERPSVEKLLEMASISLSDESREWFWRKAGIDLEVIKAHFRDEIQRRTDRWESGQFLRIPMVRELRIGTNGELLGTEEGILELPTREIPNPASIICLMGSNQPPWILRDGSRILVDRSVTALPRLFGSMVAVYFEKFPLLDECIYPAPVGSMPIPDMFLKEFLDKVAPGCFYSVEAERRQKWELMMAQAKRSGFLVGRLDLEGVEVSSFHYHPPERGPWRMVLVLQAPLTQIDEIIPLSDWQARDALKTIPIPLPPLFPEGVRIIGRVVMSWYSEDENASKLTSYRPNPRSAEPPIF
jgi:transcriptional regulator with XRE-family HTH domain